MWRYDQEEPATAWDIAVEQGWDVPTADEPYEAPDAAWLELMSAPDHGPWPWERAGDLPW